MWPTIVILIYMLVMFAHFLLRLLLQPELIRVATEGVFIYATLTRSRRPNDWLNYFWPQGVPGSYLLNWARQCIFSAVTFDFATFVI